MANEGLSGKPKSTQQRYYYIDLKKELDELKQDYFKLSDYVLQLERKLLNIENVTTTRKSGRKNTVEFLKREEEVFRLVLNEVAEFFKCKPFQLFERNRENEVITIKRPFLYCCRYILGIKELRLQRLIVKVTGMSYDRSSVYHHCDKFEHDILNSKDSGYIYELKNFENIKEIVSKYHIDELK